MKMFSSVTARVHNKVIQSEKPLRNSLISTDVYSLTYIYIYPLRFPPTCHRSYAETFSNIPQPIPVFGKTKEIHTLPVSSFVESRACKRYEWL